MRQAESGGFGVQHTPAWVSLHGALQRLFVLHEKATTNQERDDLKRSFGQQLIEEAREVLGQYKAGPPETSKRSENDQAARSEHKLQLNSLAILAVASMFDMALSQETSPQVQSLLSSGPLADKDDAALTSAWHMFMLQASSTLGLRPTLAAAPAPAGIAFPGLAYPSFDSPASPARRGVPGLVSPLGSPQPGRRAAMTRNSSELFLFEQ